MPFCSVKPQRSTPSMGDAIMLRPAGLQRRILKGRACGRIAGALGRASGAACSLALALASVRLPPPLSSSCCVYVFFFFPYDGACAPSCLHAPALTRMTALCALPTGHGTEGRTHGCRIKTRDMIAQVSLRLNACASPPGAHQAIQIWRTARCSPATLMSVPQTPCQSTMHVTEPMTRF